MFSSAIAVDLKRILVCFYYSLTSYIVICFYCVFWCEYCRMCVLTVSDYSAVFESYTVCPNICEEHVECYSWRQRQYTFVSGIGMTILGYIVMMNLQLACTWWRHRANAKWKGLLVKCVPIYPFVVIYWHIHWYFSFCLSLSRNSILHITDKHACLRLRFILIYMRRGVSYIMRYTFV